MAARKHLTAVARESLTHVTREHFAGRWARARRAGERPSLAALHARGLVVRRAWRGVEGEADAAYEYRLTPQLEAALQAKRQPLGPGGPTFHELQPGDRVRVLRSTRTGVVVRRCANRRDGWVVRWDEPVFGVTEGRVAWANLEPVAPATVEAV